MNVPLGDVDRVSKSFPTALSASLGGILGDDGISDKLKDAMNKEDLDKAFQFRKNVRTER